MQHPFPVMATLVVPLFLATADLNTQSPSYSATPDIKIHSVGNVQRVVTDGAILRQTYKGAVCVYPRDGDMENMIAGYPVLEIASHTPVKDSLKYLYSQWWNSPGQPGDTIWAVRDFNSADIPFWPSYTGLADTGLVLAPSQYMSEIPSTFGPPKSCVISIYTLAGDLVELIRHSDATFSFHDWNLTSYVGQAVASGLYLFAVEDSQTGEVQVGKFVVIR